MKVKDLIYYLQQLPQNQEIMIWNGYVGDVMPINSSVVRTELVKLDFDEYLQRCFAEEVVREGRDKNINFSEEEISELRRSYKEHYSFELNQYVTDEDIKSGRYKCKKICVLQPKLTGKKMFDRLGEVSY